MTTQPDLPTITRTCSFEKCERNATRRGWCHMHYMRWRRHGDPQHTTIVRDHPATCTVEGCERPYGSKGLCSMHWQRQHHGQPVGTPEPMLVRYPDGALCSVSGCVRRPRRNWLCEMHADRMDDRGDPGTAGRERAPAGSGYQRDDGYVEVRCGDHPLGRGGRTLAHRLALFDAIGFGPHLCHWCKRHIEWAVGLDQPWVLVGDHLDGDPRNNRATNLVASCHPCNSHRHAA